MTPEDLAPFLGRVVIGRGHTASSRRSPGTRYRHYSPRARVTLVEAGDREAMARLVEEHQGRERKVAVVVVGRRFAWAGASRPIVRPMPRDLEEYARRIFAVLRELDEMAVDEILIEKTEEKGIGLAIMDRLIRAAAR